MIPRYANVAMVDIWSSKNRYNIWYKVEAAVCDALAQIGQIPQHASEKINSFIGKIDFDEAKIQEIEAVTKHDVIAFLTYLGQFLGDEARYIHEGLTSSDLLDTSFALQLQQSADILIEDLEKLLEILKARAIEHKDTITIGRSHGIHAEPTSFGLKLAFAYSEFDRCLNRLKHARHEISTCAISGAVGTFANIDPQVEDLVAKKLGLEIEPISTQIIPRDRHAMFFATLAVIASCMERLVVEIRHLQRTEVAEAEEFFSVGQKGSSAMPHKRNPVLSENLTGLARIIRSYAMPAMENIALWHERDISHSSVERFIGPDSCITLDFALKRLSSIIENLVIYPDNMVKNVNQTHGLIYSQRVLLALVEKGLSREDAYSLVQNNAMKSWNEKTSFLNQLEQDNEIKSYLSSEELRELFDIKYHLKHVDTIFARIFKK